MNTSSSNSIGSLSLATVTLSLLSVALLASSIGVSSVQASLGEVQQAPLIQNPVNAQSLLIKSKSFTQVDNLGMAKLTVTLTNTGHQRVEWIEISVRYNSTAGELLAGRKHLVRESINPGHTIQVSVPEYIPADDDGQPMVAARPITQ